jgi:hypothetical protein
MWSPCHCYSRELRRGTSACSHCCQLLRVRTLGPRLFFGPSRQSELSSLTPPAESGPPPQRHRSKSALVSDTTSNSNLAETFCEHPVRDRDQEQGIRPAAMLGHPKGSPSRLAGLHHITTGLVERPPTASVVHRPLTCPSSPKRGADRTSITLKR